MKTRTFTFTVAAGLVAMLACSGSVSAAPGGNPGPPDDGGAPPQDFGDLIILYRNLSGVPYLTADLCQQPLPSDTCTADCVLVDGVPSGVDVIPVDPATCAVTAACATCTEETDFGRINEARSPETVFESQLADVVVNLATSDCVVSLDPAGRMVTSAGTIDSPLQNLAIYRQLMLTGTIGVSLPQDATVLDTAARGLGVASDKSGGVNVDLVAYLNQIMGLSDPATVTILDPKLCIDVKEEVQGVVQLVQKCYLDYGNVPPDDLPYAYDRSANFGALPAPAYIPEGAAVEGWFEYLSLVPGSDPPLFDIQQGPILDAVFPDTPFVEFDGENILDIGAFAQASDDTRAVISYMHTWQVPVDFETAVPCEALSDITYDVSLSDVTGLQVPKNYVNGGEREFFVNVANAGPDPASGFVTVTAGTEPGTDNLGIWLFTFTDLEITSESFVQLFTITTTSDTINWTAVVEAEFDVIVSNNTVTATSSVRASGGGGGH